MVLAPLLGKAALRVRVRGDVQHVFDRRTRARGVQHRRVDLCGQPVQTGELLRGGEQVAVHQVELGAWGFAVLGRFLVCRAQGRVAELPP